MFERPFCGDLGFSGGDGLGVGYGLDLEADPRKGSAGLVCVCTQEGDLELIVEWPGQRLEVPDI